ncbi:uncharacterized protein TNCV_756271 [Trichonephila clavipes]|nr:uncharacterized protein TNCV_756271 [Trichonephila clavipes]
MLSIKLSVTEMGSQDQTRSKLCSSSPNDLGRGLQQPFYRDSPKDALLDLSLEIELVIPFSPNQDPQDIPQQLQLGEFVHYHSSE